MSRIEDFPPHYRALAGLLKAFELYVIAIVREAGKPSTDDGHRNAVTIARRFDVLGCIAELDDDPVLAAMIRDIRLKLDP